MRHSTKAPRRSERNPCPPGRNRPGGVSRLAVPAAVLASMVLLLASVPRARAEAPDSLPVPPASAQVPDSLSAPGSSGPGAVIRSIAATGFINVDSVVVVRTFGLAPGQPYDAKEVRSGVRRLFATGLFTDVTVSDASTPDGGVALTIHVSERPRVKEIVFRGAKKIEASTLKGKLTVAEGQLLDAGTLELDARKIETAYG
ncbi:MAG TPA: POTRA domain-containing protein, partial [Candidatus Eisenbacteria bacterium]